METYGVPRARFWSNRKCSNEDEDGCVAGPAERRNVNVRQMIAVFSHQDLGGVLCPHNAVIGKVECNMWLVKIDGQPGFPDKEENPLWQWAGAVGLASIPQAFAGRGDKKLREFLAIEKSLH